ncbi:MAG TPA: cysteine dioxygenase family protein [Burkholderiales bacterium]|nr:cysteine dioxygenase family protein [Burkholderiales bacterium]
MKVLPPLRHLADRVGAALALAADVMGREVQAALGKATAEAGWLPEERRRASHDHYARHLLYADPEGRFSILAVVWDPGQRSPIHGHYCWCGVGVYQGELTEACYRECAQGGLPVLVGTARRGTGSLSFDAPAGIHRIANESAAAAISLHVYGIPGDRVAGGVNRIYV